MEIGKLTHNWGEIASLSNLEWRSYPRETEERALGKQSAWRAYVPHFILQMALPSSKWVKGRLWETECSSQAPLVHSCLFSPCIVSTSSCFLCTILIFLHRMNESVHCRTNGAEAAVLRSNAHSIGAPWGSPPFQLLRAWSVLLNALFVGKYILRTFSLKQN